MITVSRKAPPSHSYRKIAPAMLFAVLSCAQAQDSVPMGQPVASRDVARNVVGHFANSTNGFRMCLGPEHTIGSLHDAVDARLARMK